MQEKLLVVKESLNRLHTTASESIDSAIENLDKFQGGNNSAGSRVRKALQSLKKVAQESRVYNQEVKKTSQDLRVAVLDEQKSRKK